MIGNFGFILSCASRIMNMLTPFITGSLIAFLLFPISRKIEVGLLKTKIRFIKNRVRLLSTLSVLIIIALVILIALYILFKIVPLIYDGLLIVTTSLSEHFDEFCLTYKNKFKDVVIIEQTIDTLQNYFSSENLSKWISMLNYNSYVGKIASFIGYIFNFFISLIISIYILLERATLKKTFLRILNLLFDRQNVRQINRAFSRIAQILYAFVFGQIVDVFFVSYFMGLLFSLLKINNGLIFAALYFLFALIPYFGSSIGVILITFLSFVLGTNNQFVAVFIISFILQQIDANLINPKIVGQAVGLGPFCVILGIILFGGMFGIYGFFLGTPLMAICLELTDDFIKAWELKKKNKIKQILDNQNS